MNIICNSCVGSRIYEMLNMQFTNPFMWNVITYPDFKKLIDNFDNIDYSKTKISLYEYPGDPIAMATFNDNIKSYFIHYHQRNYCCGTIKHNIDVYSNNIIEYANTKVSKRTDRMLSLNEEPIFIFETRPRPRFNANYNEDDVYDFINLNNQYKRIVITSFEKFKNYPEQIGNCYILFYEDKHPDLPPDTIDMAKQTCNKFKYLFEI
jgi:uncharacterized protein (DUF1919 family)